MLLTKRVGEMSVKQEVTASMIRPIDVLDSAWLLAISSGSRVLRVTQFVYLRPFKGQMTPILTYCTDSTKPIHYMGTGFRTESCFILINELKLSQNLVVTLGKPYLTYCSVQH